MTRFAPLFHGTAVSVLPLFLITLGVGEGSLGWWLITGGCIYLAIWALRERFDSAPLSWRRGYRVTAFFAVLGLWFVAQHQHSAAQHLSGENKEFQNRLLAQQETMHQGDLLRSNPAKLTPDDQPAISPCDDSEDKEDRLTVILGNFTFSATRFPVAAVVINSRPVLSIERDDQGGVTATFDVYKQAGRHLLARVEQNVVTVVQANAQLGSRTTLHSLDVWDEDGNTVLRMNYVNKRVLKISGVLVFPGHRLEFPEAGTTVDGVAITGPTVCDGQVGLMLR